MTGDIGINNIFPNWEVKTLIGSGSYGKVYELERVEHGAVYRSAMKVITIPQDGSEIKTRLAEGESRQSVATYYQDVTKSLLSENRVMAGLKGNSNIVSYEDHQVVPHQDGIGCDIFIRMELLTSFIDYMAANTITEETAIRLGIDICKALEVCESKNIIHRDIKPGNIFVSDTEDFKLGDFGIARTIDRTTGGLSKKGTYRYMAPEVYRGDAYGRSVDICSLGLVLYYLTNGNRTPFLPDAPAPVNYNDEENALIRRMSGERLPPPKNAGNGMTAIILKACAYDPADRYQSATQMRMDLEALKAGVFQGVINNDSELTVAGWDVDDRLTQNSYNTVNGTSRTAKSMRMPSAGTRNQAQIASRTSIDSRKTILIIGISALIALLIGVSVVLILNGRSGGSTDTGAELGETQPLETGMVETDPYGIEVLNADIDWDSSRANGWQGYFEADLILYVHNGSSEPVTEAVVEASYNNGERIVSLDSETGAVYVEGYIPQGHEGVMAGVIYLEEGFGKSAKKDSANDKGYWTPKEGSFEFIETYTNRAIEPGYRMPTGSIVYHDDVMDTYGVEIYNMNDMPISQSAKLVAVVRRGDQFKLSEADATGTLNETVPANVRNFRVYDAFYDPHFWVDDDRDIVVYVIDTDYYMNAS